MAINVPVGTQLTTDQAPGTVLGPVRAIVKALDLAGADLPLEGQLLVAAPGQIPAATQTACIGSTVPLATWVMVLTAAGQTLTVPTYLLTQPQAQFGPAFIAICLPPPDVPVGTPGRATFGAKVYSAELTINGASASRGGANRLVPPSTPRGRPTSRRGHCHRPAVMPGAVPSLRRGKTGHAIVTGLGYAGQKPRGGDRHGRRQFGGESAARSKACASPRREVPAKFAVGTFFRADAAATGAGDPALCAKLQPLIGTVPCVNPTVNGFVAKSKVVKKK